MSHIALALVIATMFMSHVTEERDVVSAGVRVTYLSIAASLNLNCPPDVVMGCTTILDGSIEYR